MKLFNNPKPVIVAIIIVLGLFIAYKAKATEFEVGPTYTSQFNGGVGISVIERVFSDRIDLGVSLVGEQKWEQVHVKNNGIAWAAFVAQRPETWLPVLPSEVSVGAGYWFQDDRSPITSCHSTFLLGLKWRLGDHASVGIRHWSNAGVCEKNRGQDILTFGWRF